MNTLKPVRLRYAWQHWPKGHVFTAMPATQAQHMIAAGQAEYFDEAISAAPVNRMMKAKTTLQLPRSQRRAP